METCLKAAFSRPMAGNARVATMNRESASKMFDKPLMAVLCVAAHEMEPPAAEDDDDGSNQRRPAMARPRGRARRTGRSSGPSYMTWLHKPEEIVNQAPYTTAYQLATLLIHKQLNADEWDEAWNVNETSLRETCMAKGVHPVWHLIGEKTPLLGQFLAFPKAKVAKSTAKSQLSTEFFWVDPRDREALATVLKLATAGVDDPDTKVALQKATKQLTGGRSVTLDDSLLQLKGPLAFVTYLLHVHNGESAPASVVKVCEGEDADLCAALKNFEDLQSGEINDWSNIVGSSKDDSLTVALQTLAWQHAPAEAEASPSAELEKGLALLKTANVHEGRDRLTWWRLTALLREGEQDGAMEVLGGLRLDGSSDVADLLPLVVSMNDDRANAWLMSFMNDVDEQALLRVVQTDELEASLRLTAARRLCDEPGAFWDEIKSSVLTLLLHALDIERLATVFSNDSVLALQHPYAALLIAHLAPSTVGAQHRSNIFNSRRQALQAIHGADLPEVLSPVAEHLLLLMEGIYKETPELVEVLNKSALKAFSPISRAIAEGGVVSETHLNNLSNGLDDLDLSTVERRLFEVMIMTLSVNGHLQAYSIGMANPERATQLNDLVARSGFPLRLVSSVSHLVMEHDLGLPNLVTWYQQHDPLSPWAPLTRAALFASNGDELNSAREYSRAAEMFTKARGETAERTDGAVESDDDDSALALPLALYRKSLIHYAHATSWAEAVDLLDKVPALKTAITERFKLYLRVCHKAAEDTNEAARLIRKHVQQRITVTEEDVEGNLVERTKTVYNEEELDLLRNYPFEQAHLLPPEPFLGRVTAASTHISRDLRRTRTQFEHQFRQAMMSLSPSLDEVYEIAKNAAEDGAFEGLMYLERAQNSPKFSITSLKRLSMVEQSLFSMYKDDIPTSKRRFLHNLSLKPLVIMDTNVLVDALVEKMFQRMNLIFETNLTMMGSNRFHHILLHHAKAKRLHLMIPDDVRGELRLIAKDQRLMHRFKGAMIDMASIEHTLNSEVMSELVKDVLNEFTTWTPTSEMLADIPESSEALEAFLLHHSEVFEELTQLKELRSVTVRTELEGQAIYPESTDLDIYRLAMHLSSLPLPDIGAVLVATMDGDFTLLDRAIEERFGFGVTKNNRTLKPWLGSQTN
jgi:hypothetical protein